MKQAFHDIQLLEHEGVVFGINLGWDHTAEHEFGLKGIKRALMIEAGDAEALRVDLPEGWRRTDAGVGMRMITAIRDRVNALMWFKDYGKATKTLPAETRLVMNSIASDFSDAALKRDAQSAHMYVPMALRGRKHELPDPLATAWSGNGFIIRAFGDCEREFLKELHTAMLEGDVAIGASAHQAFGGSGLTLTIVSKMPRAIGDLVLEEDLERQKLEKVADETGIVKAIHAAGLDFYALEPKWTNFFKGESTMTSDYPVVFFLNPKQQTKHNHGWFTVEQLLEWTRGEGAVIRQEAAAAG